MLAVVCSMLTRTHDHAGPPTCEMLAAVEETRQHNTLHQSVSVQLVCAQKPALPERVPSTWLLAQCHCTVAGTSSNVPAVLLQVMALIQLDRISTLHSVPFLLMNYDGFYDKMIEFMKEMEAYGEWYAHACHHVMLERSCASRSRAMLNGAASNSD